MATHSVLSWHLPSAGKADAVKRRRWPEETGIIIILALVVVAMAVGSENFRTISNLRILLLNGAVIAYLAMGQCFVLLTGGIDLSAGADVTQSGGRACCCTNEVWPLLGVGGPDINCRRHSSWPAEWLLHPLRWIAHAYRNVLHFWNGDQHSANHYWCEFRLIKPLRSDRSRSGDGHSDACCACYSRRNHPDYRAPLYASWRSNLWDEAGNPEASRLAGVNIGKIILTVYAVSGFCASIGGMIVASRLMVGYTTAGSGQELFFSIASAVVGGVSLFGGIGTIIGALLGAILIATVSNGMNVLGVESYWQSLVIGVIILVGVTLDTYRRRISLGAQRRKRSQQSAPSATYRTCGRAVSVASRRGENLRQIVVRKLYGLPTLNLNHHISRRLLKKTIFSISLFALLVAAFVLGGCVTVPAWRQPHLPRRSWGASRSRGGHPATRCM